MPSSWSKVGAWQPSTGLHEPISPKCPFGWTVPLLGLNTTDPLSSAVVSFCSDVWTAKKIYYLTLKSGKPIIMKSQYKTYVEGQKNHVSLTKTFFCVSYLWSL